MSRYPQTKKTSFGRSRRQPKRCPAESPTRCGSTSAPRAELLVEGGGRLRELSERPYHHGVPPTKEARSVTIGEISFDRVEYDAEADVLYLHVGEPSRTLDFDDPGGSCGAS